MSYIDLDKERDFLIRLLNNSVYSGLVYDKVLDYKIRQILIEFSNPKNLFPGSTQELPSDKLLVLLDEYGISILSSILSNIHLIYSTYQLEKEFDLFLETINKNIQSKLFDEKTVLQILNSHYLTQNETSKNLVTLILSMCISKKSLEDLLFENYRNSLKQISFSLLCSSNTHIESQLKYIIQELQVKNISFDQFEIKIKPLILLFKAHGKLGLNLLINAFLQKSFDTKYYRVISIFGEYIVDWLTNSPHPSPNANLIRAFLCSLNYIKRRSKKDELILFLIENWANDPQVSINLKFELRSIIINKKILDTLDDRTVERITTYVNIEKEKKNFYELVNKLITLCKSSSFTELKKVIEKNRCGKEAALAIIKIKEPDLAKHLYDILFELNDGYILKSFAKIVIKPFNYYKLSQDLQEELILNRKISRFYNITSLNLVLGDKRCIMNDQILKLLSYKQNQLNKYND